MTRLLLTKLLRDLRAARTRIVLMVVAVSISLVVFSAVLYARSIMDREISRSYLATSPASATLLLDRGVDAGQDAALSAAARTRPGIADATLRTQFTAQIQTGSGQGSANPLQAFSVNPLQLFVAAPDDPMRMANFEVEQGTWPPPAGGILIERAALEFLNLTVGDTIVVKTPDGRPAPLKVTGVVHDPSLAPAGQEQKGYGYISSAALPLLGERPVLRELKIVVADRPGQTTPSRDRDAIVATAGGLGTWLEQTRGLRVHEIQAPPPYEHPHQGQMNAILLALLAFGGMSLLLSAVLVATMVNGLLTQQIPQIGMLKAVGARSSRVLQLYLTMVLLVAVAATAVAFVPGILLARPWASLMLTAMLNMDAASLAAPWWAYATVIAAGIGLPLLVALPPLVRASRRTVREAIGHYGVDRQGVTATRLDTWLSRIRGLDRMLLLGFRNIVRRRARLLLSVGLLASAGALFIGGISATAGILALPERAEAQRGWDVEVRLSGTASATTVQNLLAGIPQATRVEAWSRAQTGLAAPAGSVSPVPTRTRGTAPSTWRPYRQEARC